MAQEEKKGTDTRNAAVETYPFVTGSNYTNTESQEYVRSPDVSDDPDADETDEDVTDEVRAARAEVENTRAELSSTIDALKEKLSPANLVAEAKEATVGAAQNAVGDAVQSAKDAAHNVIDTAKEITSNAVTAVQGVASNVVASISGAVDTAKTAVSGVAHDAGEAAKNATQSVRDVSGTASDKAKGAGAVIVETIRLNPIPAAITGIGLGWLIMSIRRQSVSTAPYPGSGAYGASSAADRYVSSMDEYGQNNFATVSPSRIDAAKEKLSDVKDSVTQQAGDLASTVSSKASDLAQTVGDKATALGGQAKDTAQSAVSATGAYITGNPLAAGAIALLIGVGVGLLVPATEKENQLLGETRDRLKDQAAEQLHQVADKVTSVAQTAFDGAKQSVKDTVETVKTEAQNQGLTGSPA